jgi:ABC-type cobalamin transport system permease subunit
MAEKENYTIRLDDTLQIIRQTITGQIDEEDAKKISSTTRAVARELKDPRRVRILAVGANVGKTGSKVRKILMNDLNDPTLYKIALVDSNPFIKALISFMFIVTGLDKARTFSDEKDAIGWLNK